MQIRILQPGDERVLDNVAPEVFDHAINAKASAEFLRDPRHHLAVAVDDGLVVGFVSAVHYVHPDKVQPEMWINEVSVAAGYRRRGIARQLLRAVLEVGSDLGCTEAWVLTDRSNEAAMNLYSSVGLIDGPSDHVMFTFQPRRPDPGD
ncbi:MAG TPA: GNAT family N-acetyltransferase [Actinomycetota bacterium]|nr:GNAT family N-acetyltransferase [Actinomycetota bacterium]